MIFLLSFNFFSMETWENDPIMVSLKFSAETQARNQDFMWGGGC